MKTKAIFFDWMETLGSYTDIVDFKEVLTPEEYSVLGLVDSLDKIDGLDSERKEKILFGLNNTILSLFEDSFEIVKNLKNKGYKICLISNTYPITPLRIRNEFKDFLDYFDVVSFSSELGMKKPNKKIFERTLRELNKLCGEEILPEEVVMVGDSEEHDILPARKFGMQAKLIDRKIQTLKDLSLDKE